MSDTPCGRPPDRSSGSSSGPSTGPLGRLTEGPDGPESLDGPREQEHLGDGLTDRLNAWRPRGPGGARGAPDDPSGDALFTTIYPELRRLAGRSLGRALKGGVLAPTELANEAFLRLAAQRRGTWRDRGHFFALYATHLRRALVDQTRGRLRDKRGGRSIRVSLDSVRLPAAAPSLDLLDLDRALDGLARAVPTAARVVELRFFGGLSLDETAAALGLGRTTVKRKWRFARGWLARNLGPGG